MENVRTAFTQFDLAMMPLSSNSLICEDEIIVSDNFDTPYEECTVIANKFITSSHPFKVNFTMLLFCTEGCMHFSIGLEKYEVNASDMVVILPGTISENLGISSNYRTFFIAFTMPLGIEMGNLAWHSTFRKHPQLHLSDDEMQEALFIYRIMRNKMEQPDYKFTRGVLSSYIQILLYNACNHLQYSLQNVTARYDGHAHLIFDQFMELIQKHYGQEREIQYYANLMCMTPKYLSRVVYQVSGRYAGEWIRDYVILEAKALLKSGRYNVQQVSIMLNFASASFFGKYFKKAVGCSPRKYATM